MSDSSAAAAVRVARITRLRELSEFATAVQLQRDIWHFADAELLPVRLFVVATRIGGQVHAAFLGDEMVGFCLALPGLKPDGTPYLHSQMLGIRQDQQNSGVGRAIKLAQRDDAMARCIELIEWVFDPLESRLAYFNLERLGCVSRRYEANRYGMSSSPLQQALPTDRCVAEWWVRSARVCDALANQGPAKRTVTAQVALPARMAELRVRQPAQALAVQERLRDELSAYFAQGLSIVGFARGGDGGTYLLGPYVG